MATATDTFIRATSLEELRAAGRRVVHLDGHTLALFLDGEDVHACDNRCPHMGFPLHRGTIKDGILTCHWHHARFDLCSGGTFDLPLLEPEDRKAALYHGLTAVAVDSDGEPPRFQIDPLPGDASLGSLKGWFRQFVEVRDAEGTERCLVSAVRAGGGSPELADMLFAAATDHRYIRGGHVLDFTNKALEGLDAAGWERAEPVLASLASEYAAADRMEEANEWRHPIDLVAILERAFEELPQAARPGKWDGRDELVQVLFGEDPQAIADALLAALREGAKEEQLAGAVAYAAALRIARFPTSNEFGDWDTALHTFTFANAVQQGLRRAPSPELLRGVFDAAMSVYLDRFLNVPAVRLPEPDAAARPDELLEELPLLLDKQQQVNEAGALVASYLAAGGDDARLLAALGAALLREDRDFHTIQCVEAAFRQYRDLRGTEAGTHVLVAAARYLAAHSPTMRAQRQTLDIARRLQRGERLYEDVA
jgi:nitrite reductase/ring-hydroxylating ferredoxin subunit